MGILQMMPSRIRHKFLSFKLPQRSKSSGRIALAYWDKESIYFLVVAFKPGRLQLVDAGQAGHSGFPNPLAALSEQLKERSIRVQQLVVLLSRSDVDILTMDLPPADASELPALVGSEVEQQLSESDSAPIVDFIHLKRNHQLTLESTGELQTILAFSLSRQRFESLTTYARQSGFQLAGLSIRQLTALSLLESLSPTEYNVLNICVQVYAGEVELALCIDGRPLLLRTVRVNLEDCRRVAEQLSQEVERCMTLLPPDVDELDRKWLVDVSHVAAGELIEALNSHSRFPVQPVQAMIRSGQAVLMDDSPSAPAHEPTSPGTTDSQPTVAAGSKLPAALVGAARDVVLKLFAVDFVHPKQAPPLPSPWIRRGIWGTGASAAALILGWTLLSDVWQLQAEVQRLETELVDSQKLQAKLQEKSDQVQVVENWLRDQVDWLTALTEISQRLPDGQNATVRRLSGSVADSQASLELSVQVAQPEDISVLENRLRSVKYSVTSKRISQSPEASEYPWKFETRIAFPVEPIAWDHFGSQGSSEAESVGQEDEPPKVQSEVDADSKRAAPDDFTAWGGNRR